MSHHYTPSTTDKTKKSEVRGSKVGGTGEGIKQKTTKQQQKNPKNKSQKPLIAKNNLIDNSKVVTRSEGEWGEVEEGKWGHKQ